MTKEEFIRIMEEGFEQEYQGETSELRCFKCGRKATIQYVRIGFMNYSNLIVCENSHQTELIDFIVEHTNMRNRVANAFLNNECQYKKD